MTIAQTEVEVLFEPNGPEGNILAPYVVKKYPFGKPALRGESKGVLFSRYHDAMGVARKWAMNQKPCLLTTRVAPADRAYWPGDY